MNNSDDGIFHKSFKDSNLKHILMITNHGIHQWDIIPGLPDTGGQNVFVNQFADTLAKNNYKVTIVNRGGYAHPVTGDIHRNLVYKNEKQRILYIEDSIPRQIRKEDMASQIDELADNLYAFITDENISIDLLVSHYWDGAKIANEFNKKLDKPLTHVWVPHSTGAIKKRNVNPDKWKNLRVDERINTEKEIAKDVDSIAYTSFAVRESLDKDYNYTGGIFLPPSIVVDRFYPENVDKNNEIWTFLSTMSGLDANRIKECRIVTEISRTDTTKRKDVLIKAFASVHKDNPDTFLIIAIDDNEKELAPYLKNLIKELKIENYVAAIGNEWERMPAIYRITDVYCTPSIMEGFGMSAQEAAASRAPVVASALIPFATEFLVGDSPKTIEYLADDGQNNRTITQGAGTIIVTPDDVAGFAKAIGLLINDDQLRVNMAASAYDKTIPYFTWDAMIKLFVYSVGCYDEDSDNSSMAG